MKDRLIYLSVYIFSYQPICPLAISKNMFDSFQLLNNFSPNRKLNKQVLIVNTHLKEATQYYKGTTL